MFFAHSVGGQHQSAWQPLPAHLEAVSNLASLRAEKFGAPRLGALIGLLHDLGKYAREFQDYIAGRGPSPDHATAGAQEILKLATASRPDRFAALIGAYCIAGHHGGLYDWRGDRALSERLAKELPRLDPIWRHELAPQASGLFPTGFKWHEDKGRAAFQLAIMGRMTFSCLVDADYRDTERFYAETGGNSVDRDWPTLTTTIDGLISRFNAHMENMAGHASGTPLSRLRAAILDHARDKAALPRTL
jgi:CRISPR-associated endonuclease/helicase Cas3